PAAHSSSVLYGVLLRMALLTRNFFTASSMDQFPQEYAAWQMYGSNLLMPVADIDRTDRLVVLGATPAASNGSVTTMPGARRRTRAGRGRAGAVVGIAPRRTETARRADGHVAAAPGGDVYLLLAMRHVLVAEKLCDEREVRRRCAGWGALRGLVAEVTPESMAGPAGVDAETIRRLAREAAAARAAVPEGRVGAGR